MFGQLFRFDKCWASKCFLTPNRMVATPGVSGGSNEWVVRPRALADAIAGVAAPTNAAPAYYMINCAHPTHFAHVLDAGAPWVKRLRGLRANSSCRSHAELRNAPELDIGNPVELSAQYAALRKSLPAITVLGGCCSTDHRHVPEIAAACC